LFEKILISKRACSSRL